MAEPISDITEVEWQYEALDGKPVIRWLREQTVAGFQVTPGPIKDVRDTYYDTADWRLNRAKYTCRVRQKAAGAELTLKGMAEIKDGLRSRRELTEALPAGMSSPADAAGAAGELIKVVAGRMPVEALFMVVQHRETFILADGAGELGEVTVDDTLIPSDDAGTSTRLTRIEVEVDGGAVDRAKPFVTALVAATSLRPAKESKFEAGLAATGKRPAGPEHTLGSATVDAAMTAANVAYAIMRKHFAVFLANEPGTRAGEDIEALHDMRVAARRLRAGMQAFRPWLPARLETFRAQLGWVAAALGEVRDLDVQIERMDEWRVGMDPARAATLDALQAVLEVQRRLARRRMLAVLDSKRYESVVTRFAELLRRGAPASFLAGRPPIVECAPGLLRQRYRRFRKGGDLITPASVPDAYHALRIEAKKLRYALEFVGPIYGKPATDFAVRVTAIQDILGLHQDAEVAQTMLADIARAHGRRLGTDTVLTMGAISERYRAHAVELRGQFPKAYRGLRGKPWAELVKATAALQPAPAKPQKAPKAAPPA